MPAAEALNAHVKLGATTVARAWAVARSDGQRLGFTDHDQELIFDGLTFRAGGGLSARALDLSSGLAVDNSEAMGVLSDQSISERDIAAGRYDGAEVVCWLVNWADPEARKVLFRGHIGEIRTSGGAFQAELRGLTEALNQPYGRRFQAQCDAILGDGACGVDTGSIAFGHNAVVASVSENRKFSFGPMSAFESGWFQRGMLEVLTGGSAGLACGIKSDRVLETGDRVIELVQQLALDVSVGDGVRLVAGCDKRFATCQAKFSNTVNFRGFPDLPGDDWIYLRPGDSDVLDGGSRR